MEGSWGLRRALCFAPRRVCVWWMVSGPQTGIRATTVHSFWTGIRVPVSVSAFAPFNPAADFNKRAHAHVGVRGAGREARGNSPYRLRVSSVSLKFLQGTTRQSNNSKALQQRSAFGALMTKMESHMAKCSQ